MALSKTLATSNLDSNFVVSPASLAVALGMVYAGASGNTAREVAVVLANTQPSAERFHDFMSRLMVSLLSSQVEPIKTKDGNKRVELRWASRLWLSRGTPIESRFLDTLKLHYESDVRLVDFARGLNSAAMTINGWAADQTQGRIAEVVSPTALSKDTRAMLTQTVYLWASWAVAFPRSGTYNDDFQNLDGSTTSVPMMHKILSIPYVRDDGFKAIALPYFQSEWSMIFVLPEPQRLRDVQNVLTNEWLQDLRSRLRERRVAVALPKFKILSNISSLRPALEKLGIRDAFSPDAADFTKLSSSHFVYLGDINQRAMVEVDEIGTQAAAITAGGVRSADEPPDNSETFDADHPFLFFIIDRNGFVLFAGQFLDPANHTSASA